MTTKSLGHLTTTARIIPLAAAIAAAAVGTAHASERLDVASAYSTQNLFGQSAKNISERIKMMSSGEFEFAVHDPGELVPPFEIFNSVSSGAIPAGWTSIAYLSGNLPIANLYGAKRMVRQNHSELTLLKQHSRVNLDPHRVPRNHLAHRRLLGF